MLTGDEPDGNEVPCVAAELMMVNADNIIIALRMKATAFFVLFFNAIPPSFFWCGGGLRITQTNAFARCTDIINHLLSLFNTQVLGDK